MLSDVTVIVLAIVGVVCLGVFCYYAPYPRRKDRINSLMWVDLTLVVVAIVVSLLMYDICKDSMVRGLIPNNIFWRPLSAIVGAVVAYVGYDLAEKERRKGSY